MLFSTFFFDIPVDWPTRAYHHKNAPTTGDRPRLRAIPAPFLGPFRSVFTTISLPLKACLALARQLINVITVTFPHPSIEIIRFTPCCTVENVDLDL